jgi:hypothetical protein
MAEWMADKLAANLRGSEAAPVRSRSLGPPGLDGYPCHRCDGRIDRRRIHSATNDPPAYRVWRYRTEAPALTLPGHRSLHHRVAVTFAITATPLEQGPQPGRPNLFLQVAQVATVCSHGPDNEHVEGNNQ